MVFTIKLNGRFKGNDDGLLINISPQEVASQVTNYDNQEATDFGFINKVNGLIIVIREGTEPAGKYGNITSFQKKSMSMLGTFLTRSRSRVVRWHPHSTLLIRDMQRISIWTERPMNYLSMFDTKTTKWKY